MPVTTRSQKVFSELPVKVRKPRQSAQSQSAVQHVVDILQSAAISPSKALKASPIDVQVQSPKTVNISGEPQKIAELFSSSFQLSQNMKRIIGFLVFAAIGFVVSFFGLNQFKQTDQVGQVVDKLDHTKLALGLSITILAGLIGIGVSMTFFEGIDLQGL